MGSLTFNLGWVSAGGYDELPIGRDAHFLRRGGEIEVLEQLNPPPVVHVLGERPAFLV